MSSSPVNPLALRPNWILVVAVADNGVIGRGDQLPWRLSSDLQRFKSLTMGHCLLMGRKTFQSIGRPLPGRQTIVLSQSGFQCEFPEVAVARELTQVNTLVHPGRKVMVVGGSEIYTAALHHCVELWITRVRANVAGDKFFPAVEWSDWDCYHREQFDADTKNEWPTEFEQWRRTNQH